MKTNSKLNDTIYLMTHLTDLHAMNSPDDIKEWEGVSTNFSRDYCEYVLVASGRKLTRKSNFLEKVEFIETDEAMLEFSNIHHHKNFPDIVYVVREITDINRVTTDLSDIDDGQMVRVYKSTGRISKFTKHQKPRFDDSVGII